MHFSTVASGHFRPYCYIIRWSAGVGKTGVCSKLANYLKKGEMPLVGVPVYKAGTEVKPYETEKKGLEEAKKKKVDVGRLQVISIASVMKFDATSSGYSSMQAPPGTARRTRRSESRRQFAEYASTRPSPRGFGAKN
ncbi:hypothetical protein Golob_015387 [Gossypium lobatum]|uniref:SRP54-type proteins GTP-binding domain-containing protein n=1 Tax=Gossypium lobatum TaxID=34289 RepID=A0A7J8M0Z0_9ROSI|nr:hypothetical protein [Gossypium lobatum]